MIRTRRNNLISVLTNMFFISILFCAFTSCTYVVTQKPVGEVINIKEEMKAEDNLKFHIDGAWEGEHIVFAKLLEDGKTIKAASIQWDKDKKEYYLEAHDILISELNEKIFINKKVANKTEYYIAAIGVSMEALSQEGPMDMLVFYPQGNMFKKAIIDGSLEGEIKEKNYGDDYVFIKSQHNQLEDFILKNYDKLFNFQSPSVYRKIRDIHWED